MALTKASTKWPSRKSEHEQRTKHRHKAPASTSMPSSSSVLPAFANKVITKGRCLDLSFFEREGFLIEKKLRNLGLEPFYSLNLLIYLNLIKEFLSLAVHHKSGYKANLRGTEVILTLTSISNFLSILHHRNVAYIANPRKEALNPVLGQDDSDPAIIISTNELEAEPRLLLNIVHHILFSKS